MCASFFVYSSVAEKKNIVFLLGAGFSQEALGIGSNDLSNSIRNRLKGDEPLFRESIVFDGFYDSVKLDGHEYDNSSYFLERAQALARMVSDEMVDWPRSQLGSKFDYEDFFLVVDLLEAMGEENRKNPTILPLYHRLVDRYRSEFVDDKYRFDNSLPSVLGACGEVKNLILDTVWRTLERSTDNLNQLKFLREAICDESTGEALIFTLNHDLILDEIGEQTGLNIVDGFTRFESRFDIWDSSLFENAADAKLFKLHGGIDWRSSGYGTPTGTKMLKHLIDGPALSINEPEKVIYASFRPPLLLGTFNKVFAYQGGIYLELLHKFNEVLRESDFLIVCGCRFRDFSINSFVHEWYNDDESRKLVLIDKNVAEIAMRLLHGILEGDKSVLYQHLPKDRVKSIQINDSLSEVSWPEISDFLFTSD